MAERDINYAVQGFSDYKKQFIEFAKTYFPDTYTDFSEASPGMLFIELAASLGDVLGFYVDTQIQENFTLQYKEKENAINQAYVFGYFPRMTYTSSTIVDFYQVVPSSGGEPNMDYALFIKENSIITSASTNKTFILVDNVDFTDEPEVNIYDDNFFSLKKSVRVVSSEIKTQTFTFTSPEKYSSIEIIDDNIIGVLDVVDTSGERWNEVPYLAQDSIFEEVDNTLLNNPFYNIDDEAKKVLKIKKVPKRYVARFKDEKTLSLQFGAGVSSTSDDLLIPNPNNAGSLPISQLDLNWDKGASVITRQYGLAPSNTTLTVRYTVGGGVQSNVPSNDLTELNKSNVTFKNILMDLSDPTQSLVYNNLTLTNPNPSSGGKAGDTLEEIRQNTLLSNTAQMRAVTLPDLELRALSMPSDLGTVAKAYATNSDIGNDLAIDLYVLAYNENGKIARASETLKNNLKTYLGKYKMGTDGINIKNGYYINLGLNFDITTINGYNNGEVLSNCINKLKNLLSIDRLNMNQPIVISDIYSELLKVKGVQSVVKVELYSINGNDYSEYSYDVAGAIRSGILYPSLDPSIFEIRYPDNDIKGRIINY